MESETPEIIYNSLHFFPLYHCEHQSTISKVVLKNFAVSSLIIVHTYLSHVGVYPCEIQCYRSRKVNQHLVCIYATKCYCY